MEAVSINDYRNYMTPFFNRAANGERVLIRRKNRLFALTSVADDDIMITPALQRRIDEAEKACREGRCVSCSTEGELQSFFDSL